MARLQTFDERFRYLKLVGAVGEDKFGFDRYLNQSFYSSKEWKRVREQVILRDNGCDLGIEGYPLYSRIYIHHINPIQIEDFDRNPDILLDLDNLVCTSFDTHQAIHFGSEELLPKLQVARFSGDTCPWKHI